MQLTADPRVFPPSPPRDINDASIIAEHDWAAFGAVEEMTNHWDRPGWTATTRAYYWMLTFPEVPALTEHARRCQSALRDLGFDEIAEDGLHLTLGRIGHVGEVTTGQLGTLIAAVSDGGPEAFNIQAVPLTASRGAIRYSIAPWTPVVHLHAALAAAGTASGLPSRKPPSILRPHLGIAYCNRPMPARAVRDAVRPLRTLASVDVPVRRVQLVALRREGRAYRWDVIHELELR